MENICKSCAVIETQRSQFYEIAKKTNGVKLFKITFNALLRLSVIMTPINDLTPFGMFLLGEEPVTITFSHFMISFEKS